MKNDGIIEKSTMPSVGELSFKPFHNTCVCDGEVPRNDAVARDPRPDDLMNMGVFCERTSAMLLTTVSRSVRVSRSVLVVPTSVSGRLPVTDTSCNCTSRFGAWP